jgi:hypothetical protein
MDAASAVIKTINATPSSGTKIFLGLVAEIFTDTFFGPGYKIFTAAFYRFSAKIFSRSDDQGRQVNRPDHTNRGRASK